MVHSSFHSIRPKKMAAQCKFWLPKKRRFCANSPLSDSIYCGNHTQRSDADWIPCPIDPSHCVLEENLKCHLKRCPLLKQAQFLSRQPFYQKGVNAGGDEEADEFEAIYTSEMKRNMIYAMSVPQFLELIAKIKTFHASLCDHIPESYITPEACSDWINREVDRKFPYREKHVLQQASILGNLEVREVLKDHYTNASDSEQDCEVSAVVEFGAGRGYLAQMLADCYGIKKVILVERRSYKLKADRSLRQKTNLQLERLRIDIEDLDIKAVDSLRGTLYTAIGKHLCGPATDVTLRCCIYQPSSDTYASENGRICRLRGLAVATCCHHLCQWRTYINKKFISEMGFTREEFHAISWFTSWAVDSDHGGSEPCLDDSFTLHEPVSKETAPESGEGGVGAVVKNMSCVERAVLGNMCKDIIDTGRVLWMREQGLKCELVKYVPYNVSPENRLLVGRP